MGIKSTLAVISSSLQKPLSTSLAHGSTDNFQSATPLGATQAASSAPLSPAFMYMLPPAANVSPHSTFTIAVCQQMSIQSPRSLTSTLVPHIPVSACVMQGIQRVASQSMVTSPQKTSHITQEAEGKHSSLKAFVGFTPWLADQTYSC